MLTTANETTRTWLQRYYKLVDAKKVEEFLRFFTPDARLKFANNAPVVGLEAIRVGLGGLLDSVAGIHHEIQDLWEAPNGAHIYEVNVTYKRKEGREVVVPSAVFCTLREGLFREQRIYIDLAPVYI